MAPEKFWGLAIVMLMYLGFAGLGLYWARKERERSRTWTCIKEGICIGVSTAHRTYRKRSGAMAHTTTTRHVVYHTLHFADGGILEVKDVQRPAIGLKIRVYKNGLSDYRIEMTSP